jgi:p-cumate 2,3-dioxygenase beta subunit
MTATTATAAPVLSRAQAETFLYHEARLIDSWQLEAWAALFADDGEYLIPPIDAPDSVPSSALYLVYDDRFRLEHRAKRLLNRLAHAEFPRSKVRHLIGNVEVGATTGDAVRVTCNAVVFRSRGASTEMFPGHCEYDLVAVAGGELRIRRKRFVIDTDSLREQGRVSIIL